MKMNHFISKLEADMGQSKVLPGAASRLLGRQATTGKLSGSLQNIKISNANNNATIRTAKSRMSTRSQIDRGTVYSKATGKPLAGEATRRMGVKPGDIINVSIHTSDPGKTSVDAGPASGGQSTWTGAETGMVYSKRRFVVVLWMYEEGFFAVPLYTFAKKGISEKSVEEQKEYVCVQRQDDNHKPQNTNGILEIEINLERPSTTWSYAHVAGGAKIGYHEDYKVTDQLTTASYHDLTKLWYTINGTAYAAAREKLSLSVLPGLGKIFAVDPKAAFTVPAAKVPSVWDKRRAGGR